MSEQEQQIAIAEACGWRFHPDGSGYIPPNGTDWVGRGYKSLVECAPDYLRDLNAMDEATKTLDRRQRIIFCNNLTNICGGTEKAIDASAAKRAKAFLLTVNKWKE